jgi:hypothetical protein
MAMVHIEVKPEYIGFALFIVSEIIGMAKVRPNSITQLALQLLRQAFPYNPGR